MKCPRCGKEVQFVTDYEWVCPNCGEDGIIDDTLEKIKKVCRGCKYFSVSDEGGVERYECLNDNRWLDLGYEDDDYETYGDDIHLIAVARYNSEGNIIDIELIDMDFDFDGCKWREEKDKEGSR